VWRALLWGDFGVALGDEVEAIVVPLTFEVPTPVAAVAGLPDSISPPRKPPAATAPVSTTVTMALRNLFIDRSSRGSSHPASRTLQEPVISIGIEHAGTLRSRQDATASRGLEFAKATLIGG
jgi:hypothetical protein